MLLIVGLGNPGPQYAGHRHNAGFMVLDAIARAHRFGPWRRKFEGDLSEGALGGEKALLLKPMTYMNESGRSVQAAVQFYKISLDDLVVVHDELDLQGGKIRMKRGGGDAGHNGLRSITAALGSDYRRLRIGIGHPGVKELVAGYALHDFSKAERQWLDPLIDAIAESAPLLADGDDQGVMNRVAVLTRPSEPKSKPETTKD